MFRCISSNRENTWESQLGYRPNKIMDLSRALLVPFAPLKRATGAAANLVHLFRHRCTPLSPDKTAQFAEQLNLFVFCCMVWLLRTGGLQPTFQNRHYVMGVKLYHKYRM